MKYENTGDQQYGGKISARVEPDDEDEGKKYRRMSMEKFEEIKSKQVQSVIDSARENYEKEY